MKIDVGSGNITHRGYKSVDIDPKFNPDYLGDFREMEFEDIEAIRAHHILEHFGRDEGVEVLKLWYSWLKKGGTLLIEVPDFEEICKNFDKDKYWMTRHAFGAQDAEHNYHRDGWYREKFENILPKIGFKIQEFRQKITRDILPNLIVIAKK